MADVRPFRALRPRDDLAGCVIAPPYDVISESEARAIASEPLSFVHVTRAEVDLPPGTDAHSDAAYQQARANLDALTAEGILVTDPEPRFYLYGQAMGNHVQIGVLAGASVSEYDQNLVRKHELTRPDKEDDRTHHMEVLDAQVGLVFLTYKPTVQLAKLIAMGAAVEPAWTVTTDDGVIHRLWPVPAESNDSFQAAFAEVPVLYIADGHHRSAAASRVLAKRKDAASQYFLAGLFPSDNLQVMAYNRVVHDLNGMSDEAFLARVGERFLIDEAPSPIPAERGTITMYFRGTWTRLRIRPDLVDGDDPVARLDVSILQDNLLGPILGIDDPRRSTRIDFVGGIRGFLDLEHRVEGGHAVAFHLFPTGMDQLFDVADAGSVMPPKSTWFEPKLREGVVVRSLS